MNTGYIMYTVGQTAIVSSDPSLSMFLIIGVSGFLSDGQQNNSI